MTPTNRTGRQKDWLIQPRNGARSYSAVPIFLTLPRTWKETKQEPGTAGPGSMLGCYFVSFHFLWAILSKSTVLVPGIMWIFFKRETICYLDVYQCQSLSVYPSSAPAARILSLPLTLKPFLALSCRCCCWDSL